MRLKWTKIRSNPLSRSNAKSMFVLYILTEQIIMVGEIGRGLSTH